MSRGAGRRRSAIAGLAVVLAVLAPATAAAAYWQARGDGSGAASSGTLAPPTEVMAAAAGGMSVAVSWSASTDPAPMAYFVIRTSDGVDEAACGTSAIATISTTSCIDDASTVGTYTYRAVAVHHSWTAASAPSDEVIVELETFLGSAASFSILGINATNSAVSTVSGDVGVTPVGAVVGFSSENVGGDIHINDAVAADAAAALVVAYDYAADRDADTEFPGDPNGMTFTPGVHYTAGAMSFTGTITFDALGDENAVFIMQINGAITAAANSTVVLVGGALASNIYWQVNGASDHGAGSTFSGTIMATGAITFGANVELIGRALSQAAVTLGGAEIRFTIAPPPTVTITGGSAITTDETAPIISGTTSAVAGQPVTVTIDSQVLTTTVQADGSWSVTATELPAGLYSVSVGIRDAAGNGGRASQQLTIEVNPPTIALGAASPFSVLTQSNVVGTGTSTLAGELGVSPGTSVTGFPPGTSGGEHLGDAAAAAAAEAADAAYSDGMSRTPHFGFADPSGLTFHTGVHHTSAAVVLTGNVTLDAQGDASAVFIFQIEGALTTAAASQVLLVGGAQASNVFWVVLGAASIGAGSTFAGTIITSEAVTLGDLAQLRGRVLAGGTVTLANNTITGP